MVPPVGLENIQSVIQEEPTIKCSKENFSLNEKGSISTNSIDNLENISTKIEKNINHLPSEMGNTKSIIKEDPTLKIENKESLLQIKKEEQIVKNSNIAINSNTGSAVQQIRREEPKLQSQKEDFSSLKKNKKPNVDNLKKKDSVSNHTVNGLANISVKKEKQKIKIDFVSDFNKSSTKNLSNDDSVS
jgi:hypothetical protein